MSERKPKISVIIPVYNGEKFLEDTLKAIGKSSYENLEILIIDDGSTDGSQELYEGYAKRDSRVRCFYQKNAGIVAARNKGIDLATGDFLCFCDQDDLVSSDMYKIMIEKIQEDHSDLCICGTSRITEDLEKTPFEILKTRCYERTDIIKGLLTPLLFAEFKREDMDRDLIIYGTIWKVMIRSSFLQEKGLHFRRFVNFEDDWIMIIELMVYAQRVSTVKDSLYWWRVNTKSESYNWKYIEEIDKKYERLDQYMRKVFQEGGLSESYIQEYQKAKSCIDIVKVFENEASPRNSKTLKQKIKFLKSYMENKERKDALYLRKQMKKGYIRYSVMLGFLELHWVMGAYCTNKLLKLFAIYGMNHKWGVKLDKGLKKGRKKGN